MQAAGKRCLKQLVNIVALAVVRTRSSNDTHIGHVIHESVPALSRFCTEESMY